MNATDFSTSAQGATGQVTPQGQLAIAGPAAATGLPSAAAQSAAPTGNTLTQEYPAAAASAPSTADAQGAPTTQSFPGVPGSLWAPSAQGAAGGPGSTGSFPGQAYQQAPASPDSSRAFAITSFVLGVASIVSGWTFIAPITGLVFGVLALRRNTSERTLTLWGLWLNGAMLALSAIAVLLGVAVLGFGLLALPFVH